MRRSKKQSQPEQMGLKLERRWGGKRAGAGRKKLPKERRSVPHRSRPTLRQQHPVHVTWRVADHVWNLRSARGFRALLRAFVPASYRFGLRITHLSVQGNHVHLIVEANGRAALYQALRGLGIRIAKGLNRLMQTSDPVFADRYHVHPLGTPREAWNAIRYVLKNHAIHAARQGRLVARRDDDFAVGPGVGDAPDAYWRRLVDDGSPVAPPVSWLLTTGWRRAVAV